MMDPEIDELIAALMGAVQKCDERTVLRLVRELCFTALYAAEADITSWTRARRQATVAALTEAKKAVRDARAAKKISQEIKRLPKAAA